MKRPLSRLEWLLIGSPLIGLGVFACLNARRKAVEATNAPAPLATIFSISNGPSVMVLGQGTDSSGNPVPLAGSHILVWNAREKRFSSQLTEEKRVVGGAITRDGKQLGTFYSGAYNTEESRYEPGEVTIQSATGEEIRHFQMAAPSPMPVPLPFSSPSVPTAPSLINSPDVRSLTFTPDSRELLCWSYNLERYDIKSGVLMGTLKASNLFSTFSYFRRVKFSPNGRFLVLLENCSRSNPVVVPPYQVLTPTYVTGGRAVIVSYPSLKIVKRLEGDLYFDFAWASNDQLYGISAFYAGDKIQNLVRSQIAIPSTQTHLDVLDLPADSIRWEPESLAINGNTGQMLLANPARFVVWDREGKIKTNLPFSPLTLPSSIQVMSVSNSIPRFSSDGNTVLHINGTTIESYNLAPS